MIRILGKIENNILPAIETDRLYLRQRLVADAADVFEYAKLAEVSYPAGFPPVATLEDEIYYIENILPKRFEEQNIPSGYGIGNVLTLSPSSKQIRASLLRLGSPTPPL